MNKKMGALVTNEELKEVLASFKWEKSQGPNRWMMDFYID
jgi:hypothetical protein